MGKNNIVEKVTIDERGRVTIPKSIREKYISILERNSKL